MSLQVSFSDLVSEAVSLDFREYEKFVSTVNKLRAEQQPSMVSKQESLLLAKINRGFPTEKWLRMHLLDAKMEENKISKHEHEELTSLTNDYEKYCVQRIRLLKKLALLRNISLEKIMNKMSVEHAKD